MSKIWLPITFQHHTSVNLIHAYHSNVFWKVTHKFWCLGIFNISFENIQNKQKIWS